MEQRLATMHSGERGPGQGGRRMRAGKKYLLIGLVILALAPLAGCDQVGALVGLQGAPGDDGNNGGMGPQGPEGDQGEYGAALLPWDGCVENGDLAGGAVDSLERAGGSVRNRNIQD